MDQSSRIGGQRTGQPAEQTKETVKHAATDVAETAKEQIRDVADEVKLQSRNVATQLRDGVAEQARVQQDNLAQTVRRVADELEAMAQQRPDSPAATVVSRVADGGQKMAQYLAERGPEGVLAEVQDFARRRPGAFLATALVSGFVIGRLGRGVIGAASASPADDRPLGSTAADAEDTLVYSTASSDGVYASGGLR